MSEFKVGTLVYFVDNNDRICKGVIDAVFDFSDSLIISARGLKYKRRFDDIVVIEEKPVESEEPKEEPKKVKVNDNPVITISRDEFIRKGAELCANAHMGKGVEEALKYSMLVAELAVVLFTEVKCD